MCMIFLLCLIIWTLQSMAQDSKCSYIDELCHDAYAYTQIGDFERALHWCNTAVKFYQMRKLNNIESLCKIWTHLGNVYGMRWLKNKTIRDLSQASNYFREAVQHQYIPALEGWGVLSMYVGNYEQAVGYLQKVIADDWNVIENKRRIGICYQQIGDDQKAMLFLGRAYLLGDVESFKLLQHF